MGGRDAEMTFGIGTIDYSALHDGVTDSSTDLAHKPSDAVASFTFQNTANGGAGLSAGKKYQITSLGGLASNHADVTEIVADSDLTTGTWAVGTIITVATDTAALSGNATFKELSATNKLTEDIEAVQALVNTARVQAGSQYAAIESAVNYTTDLTAQYELGYNTVNDVNFSMETAHLAKNQILQQAATAMLAQANQGQQGLLQLIQG